MSTKVPILRLGSYQFTAPKSLNVFKLAEMLGHLQMVGSRFHDKSLVYFPEPDRHFSVGIEVVDGDKLLEADPAKVEVEVVEPTARKTRKALPPPQKLLSEGTP